MISAKALLREYKRLPKLMDEAYKNGDVEEALHIKYTIETIEWILSDED
jgi:hypothetical protein